MLKIYYIFNCDYKDVSKLFESFNWTKTFSQYSTNDTATVFNNALNTCIKQNVPLGFRRNLIFLFAFPLNLKVLFIKLQKHGLSFGI